jgi:circadian clock protein KaiC
MKKATLRRAKLTSLPKTLTGIEGLDDITGGGFPQGRPTLICGSAGCGKTLLAMEFLVRGALNHGEPGVFMAFEETAEELAQNVKSLGFDLDDLVKRKLLAIDYVRVERHEVQETGEYDLEGLFVRLGHAIDSIGARRVVLDTIESLFSGLSNAAVLRAELRRLFRWLKDKGITAVITAERGQGALTRQGLEEYVSDCVIMLDHRVDDQVSTRRVRIVKYRGSTHGTNEYPFLIDADGISVLPITSAGLRHDVTTERISSGVERLDAMLGGRGYFRGSSVLVSGTAGSGKSSLAAHFADAACRRGEKCLYFAFEESPSQVVRNMRSIGIDLEKWVKKDVLRFHAIRSTMYGHEMHLASMHKLIKDYQPSVVVVDPVGSLLHAGTQKDASALLTRLIDFLKLHNITAFMTNLTSAGDDQESTDVDISSLVDTWVLLRGVEVGGERNRALYILKSRGMPHSNQLREFLLTDKGIEILDVYLGPEGVLTGSMRLSQEAREKAEVLAQQQEVEAKESERKRRREAMEARIAAIRKEFDAEEYEAQREINIHQQRATVVRSDRERMARSRRSDTVDPNGKAPVSTTKARGNRK